jgi:hypothetical protein
MRRPVSSRCRHPLSRHAFATVAVLLGVAQTSAFTGPACSGALFWSSKSDLYKSPNPHFSSSSALHFGLPTRFHKACSSVRCGTNSLAVSMQMNHPSAFNRQSAQPTAAPALHFEEEKTFPRMKRPEELKELVRICRYLLRVLTNCAHHAISYLRLAYLVIGGLSPRFHVVQHVTAWSDFAPWQKNYQDSSARDRDLRGH